MKIPKPTDDDRAYFERLFAHRPGVEVKPMFGNLGAFVNGHMAAGLFGRSVGLRLADGQREELLAQPGAGPFGPEDRPMKDYVALPDAWRDLPDAAEPWIERAIADAAARPPKTPKRRTT